MKSYRDFEKQFIGTSDIASLTVRSGMKIGSIDFGEDGCYSAYICFGDDVEIGEHYSRVFEGSGAWLKIYDDFGLAFEQYTEFIKCSIYVAGNFGCIIHFHNN